MQHVHIAAHVLVVARAGVDDDRPLDARQLWRTGPVRGVCGQGHFGVRHIGGQLKRAGPRAFGVVFGGQRDAGFGFGLGHNVGRRVGQRVNPVGFRLGNGNGDRLRVHHFDAAEGRCVAGVQLFCALNVPQVIERDGGAELGV